MSDMLRLTGMVSGMDTDATVKKLIQLEQNKVYKAEQTKQLLEWEKEQYREISTAIKSFQDQYFDLLKPATNFRSKSAFNVFEASATMNNVATSVVSVSSSANSQIGQIKFASISKLATKDTYKSDAKVIGDLKSFEAVDYSTVNTEISSGNNTLTFTLDGTAKTITLSGGYADNDAMVADINTKLAAEFPGTTIEASNAGGEITFVAKKAGVVEEGHIVEISSAHSTLLAEMKFVSGQSNKLNYNRTVEEVFNLTGSIGLTINGKSDFGIESTDTVAEMMTKINNGSAGVTLSYNTTLDKFSLTSNSEGTTSTITKTDSGGLLSAMKLNDYSAAQDAEFVLSTPDGNITTTRDSNTFKIDGTEITLNETSATEVVIDVASNTDDVKDKIIKFVDEYNNLIEMINNKVSERKYYDYAPLTTEQKKELEEEEENAWQAKAKSGLLKGDNGLESMTEKLRRALYESVDGVGITLKDIGITTTADFKSKGKLTIDEDKLTKALAEKPNDVIALFTNESDKKYLDDTAVSERYNENGLANRLFDIIRDNIRTTNGNGYLIKKAGNPDFTADTSSDLYKNIKQANDKIDNLLRLLEDKETTYYNQFARMEQALSRMNNQSASILQQMGA